MRRNASVRALREVISGVVDDHGYRAGARRMAAALAAGREDGFIVGEPGAPANGGVCSPRVRWGSTMGSAAAVAYCRMMAPTMRRPGRVWLARATYGG